MQKSWDTIKHLLGKQTHRTKIQGNVIKFELVSVILKNKFPQLEVKLINNYVYRTYPHPQTRTVPFFSLTYEERLEIMKGLENSEKYKDFITIRIFKSMRTHIIKILTWIIS